METLKDKRPHIKLALNTLKDISADGNSFEPLRLPEELQVDLAQANGQWVETSKNTIEMHLKSGSYQLPLSYGNPCTLEIPETCFVKGEVNIGPSSGSYLGTSLIQSLAVDIHPPIIFHDILMVLWEINKVFKDKRLYDLFDRLTNSLMFKAGKNIQSVFSNLIETGLEHTLFHKGSQIRNWFENKASDVTNEMKEHLFRIAKVMLCKVEAHSVLSQGAWRLSFSFSGYVTYFDSVTIPFHKINLPPFILPYPHAALDKLVSNDPLATAVFLKDNVPFQKLLETLSNALDRFNISFNAKGLPPLITADIESLMRWMIHGDSNIKQKFFCEGKITGKRKEDVFTFQMNECKLSSKTSEMYFDLSGELNPIEMIRVIMDNTLESNICLKTNDVDQQTLISDIQVQLKKNSRINDVHLSLEISHPQANVQNHLPVFCDVMSVVGTTGICMDRCRNIGLNSTNMSFVLGVHLGQEANWTSSKAKWIPQIDNCRIKGDVAWKSIHNIDVTFAMESDVRLDGTVMIEDIPELSISKGDISVVLQGKMNATCHIKIHEQSEYLIFSFEGTTIDAVLNNASIRLIDQKISFQNKISFQGNILKGYLCTDGLGELDFHIQWDTHGISPVLQTKHGRVNLLLDGLMKGDMIFHITQSGGIRFTGKPLGFYDASFFSALVTPENEPKKFIEILKSDELVDHILDVLRVLSPEQESKIAKLVRQARKLKRLLESEGVTDPKDLIPRLNMARILSKYLIDNESFIERLVPIIKQTTDGNGLNRTAVKQIINEVDPDHDYEYEVDRGLRWLDHIVSPADPMPPVRQHLQIPVVEVKEYQTQFSNWPSAGDVYAALQGKKKMSSDLCKKIAILSPYFTLEQIDYILNHAGKDWNKQDINRISDIQKIKQRIRMIADGFGGIGYGFQPLFIGMFLNNLFPKPIERTEALKTLFGEALPSFGDGLIGPEDMAVLIHSCIAQPAHGLVTQIILRELLNYLDECGGRFVHEVLIEMSSNSARILTGLLFSFIEQSQSYMKHNIDIAERLSQYLGIHVPIRNDYMAQGKWANHSYYNAILNVAEFILENADKYRALKNHLQVERHPINVQLLVSSENEIDSEHAQKAIQVADELGYQCQFKNGISGPIDQAKEAYEKAFLCCRTLLEKDKFAFQLPWFKAFWLRNYEALVVLSIVRNYQEDIDRVRNWVHVRTKKTEFTSEQDILEAVIQALYYVPKDREVLLNDPLVRLLMDPPLGKYDFTIVSCMGLITEGAKGTELEETFCRLKAIRGVETIRADTKTMRTLEYNAKKIIEVIEKIKTPWGYVGYSQGCANGWMAENILLGGTPDQQSLLAGLTCRNLLFGAHNGSAHGSCGKAKIRRAMIEGELILKHYQAVYSSWAVKSFLHGVNKVLDSSFFVHLIGGAESISYESCIMLARDGQFLPHVPISTVRGVAFQEILPESLEFLSNVLEKQIDGELHDTQVALTSTVGSFTTVTNSQNEILQRCDMGSFAQSSHHWSPLLKETEFVTTQRDIDLAIYDFPKDRHIFPWIEVNARFGLIKQKNE
ncbi:MAG: hypothetical protein HQK77_00600 [Desulfobacterales bacterium]|nr:hypothetical protein [Desulfobacterales bacterium]